MKSDIEIARAIKLQNIKDIASDLGVGEDEVDQYGKYMGKLSNSLIGNEKKGNLILVTSITPTKAGIGKTTTSIGLALGLCKLGKKAIVALREPSLGPCFGMKGGAAGGGYAQVLPMENINLHFTGDFHAVSAAHNMITALLDNFQYRNRGGDNMLKEILWKRVLDVNDRSLRYIVSGLNGSENGIPTETGFDITPASEIMAILCLASNLDDLKYRIGKIILGFTSAGTPFTVNDLGVAGAITVLLKDAIRPNLVQTTEHTPAIIHGGPFANIAHGCNSVIATKTALSLGDYVITEAGFGADLGAEKFFNIKCRKAGLSPKLTVLVVTTQALKMHGNIPIADIKKKNTDGLVKGFDNLDQHIQNIQGFGQTVLVILNKFYFDDDDEIRCVHLHCEKVGVKFAINESFASGSVGAVEMARVVVDTIDKKPSGELKYTYDESDTIETKIEKIATKIYRAQGVTFTEKALKKINVANKLGLSHFPICIAKTQYSFSDNAHSYGVPKGFTLSIKDVVINNGAEFLVAVAGDIMRMPGLPQEPQALHIDIVNGVVDGLS